LNDWDNEKVDLTEEHEEAYNEETISNEPEKEDNDAEWDNEVIIRDNSKKTLLEGVAQIILDLLDNEIISD
jgi:hypothetical protein